MGEMNNQQTQHARRGLPPLRSQLALEAVEQAQGCLLAAREALMRIEPVPQGPLEKLTEAIEANAEAAGYAEEVLILDQMEFQRRRIGALADYNDKLRPRVMVMLRRQINEKVLPPSNDKTLVPALGTGTR